MDSTTSDSSSEASGEGRADSAALVPGARPVAAGANRLLGSVGRLWQRARTWRLPRLHWREGLARIAAPAAELCIILSWAILVTLPYFNFNPAVSPTGTEFPSAIQSHYIWLNARECGWCSLWYGNSAGGFPSFVDPISSVLHPLVIVTTLLWGVVNGAKMTLVLSFMMAGVAQWWLASVMKLGRAARVWSGCMVVAAGHLAARMDLGAFNMVLSAATCSLVIPPLVILMQTGRRRAAVVLGIVLALAGVSGNGYFQIALGFCLLAVPLLLPWNGAGALLRLRRLGLALLLAAPFLLPYIHFLPNMAKDYDINFETTQQFSYVPLNLVINDYDFYKSEVLGKIPYASHYVIYTGWIPVFLALWGLFGIRRREEVPIVAFLFVSMLLAFWVASAEPLRWLIAIAPDMIDQFLAGARYASIMSGMGIPYLLALSALGLDRLTRLEQFRIQIGLEKSGLALRSLHLDPRWLLLVPCVLALHDAWLFNSHWISVKALPEFVPPVIAALQTLQPQWVNVPNGQHFYVEPSVGSGLKLSNDFFRTWHWRDRDDPLPLLEANVDGLSPHMTNIKMVEGIYINRSTRKTSYAAVQHEDGPSTVCFAQGRGGDIDATCELKKEGVLTVQENNWSGWQAQIDGQPAVIGANRWLSVKLPAGKHTVAFRYRPWDVRQGLLLCVVGVIFALYLWVKRDNPHAADEQPPHQAEA